MPPGVELSAFRILQEAVTYVLEHSRATQVDCTIRYDDGALHLQIVDDGRPPRGSVPSPGSGHGLIGMRERVALYGGTLDAGQSPGNGYHVAAVLPLPRDPS